MNTQVKTKTVSVQNVPILLCLQTCMRKLGPIIYSQDHCALSKLAFLVDNIQKERCPGKKKKTFKNDDTVLCEFYNRNSRQLLTPFIWF